MTRHGVLVGLSYPSAVVVLVGEDRRDCQRRVRERDEHLHESVIVLCVP